MLPEEIETSQKTKQRKYCITERLRDKCDFMFRLYYIYYDHT